MSEQGQDRLAAIEERAAKAVNIHTSVVRQDRLRFDIVHRDVPALCKALRVALAGLETAGTADSVSEAAAFASGAFRAALAELPGAEAGGEKSGGAKE